MLLSNLLRPGKGHIEQVADLDVHSVRSARRSDLEVVWLSVNHSGFDLSDVYSKEDQAIADYGFSEIFFDGNQEESRNPASWDEKLTEKELESIFGGLQD